MAAPVEVVGLDGVSKVWKAGSQWGWTFTLKKDGALLTDSLVGATLTSTLRHRETGAILVAGKALVNVNNTLKTGDLVFTDAENGAYPSGVIEGDVKVVLSGGTTYRTDSYFATVERPVTE